jgi:hypothetical protein
LQQYDAAVSFVSNKVGSKGVTDLERLATALYVTQHFDDDLSVNGRVAKITALKPHIGRDEAAVAVMEVDRIIEESRE